MLSRKCLKSIGVAFLFVLVLGVVIAKPTKPIIVQIIHITAIITKFFVFIEIAKGTKSNEANNPKTPKIMNKY